MVFDPRGGQASVSTGANPFENAGHDQTPNNVLQDLSNSGCLPGRAGGSPNGLAGLSKNYGNVRARFGLSKVLVGTKLALLAAGARIALGMDSGHQVCDLASHHFSDPIVSVAPEADLSFPIHSVSIQHP